MAAPVAAEVHQAVAQAQAHLQEGGAASAAQAQQEAEAVEVPQEAVEVPQEAGARGHHNQSLVS